MINSERHTMERAAALKKLGKILGKSLGYRVDTSAPTPEERTQAMVDAVTLSAAYKEAAAAKDARYKAILAADVEYQELFAKCADLRKARDQASYTAHRHYKITVGTTNTMFFLVRAQGDSWEDVIDQLTAKKTAA